jgi:Na+-transporting methylmalonyl-CoA/oxaloacetate decarboxylase gamma subunit
MNIIYYIILGFGVIIVFLIMLVLLVLSIKKSIENGTDPNDL